MFDFVEGFATLSALFNADYKGFESLGGASDPTSVSFAPSDVTQVCGCPILGWTKLSDLTNFDQCVTNAATKSKCTDFVSGVATVMFVPCDSSNVDNSAKTLTLPYTYSKNMNVTSIAMDATGFNSVSSVVVDGKAVKSKSDTTSKSGSVYLTFDPLAVTSIADSKFVITFDKAPTVTAAAISYYYELNLTGTTSTTPQPSSSGSADGALAKFEVGASCLLIGAAAVYTNMF